MLGRQPHTHTYGVHIQQGTESCSLRGLLDAPPKAYSGVVYLKGCQRRHCGGDFPCSALLGVQTIPMLELCGILLLAELLSDLADDLGIHPR